MKKSDFLLIGIVILIIGLSLFSVKGNETLAAVDYPITLSGESGLNEMTYDQYEKFMNDGNAFIVVIEREGCGYCTMYMPIVKEVAEEKNIPIYYIDIAYLTNEENNKLASSNSYLRKNQWGTPTTLLMLGNRVLDSIGGYVEKETFLSFLEDKVVMGE